MIGLLYRGGRFPRAFDIIYSQTCKKLLCNFTAPRS